jgi:hypothetical protein
MRRIVLALVASIVLAASSVDASRLFAGSTHIVSAGADTMVDIHTAITVCAWIYPTSAAKLGRIIQHGDSGGSPTIEWNLKLTAGGKVSFETQVGASPIGLTTVTTNIWQPACGLWSTTNAIVYLNGSADASMAGSGTVTHSSNLTEIGNSTIFGGNDFQGRIAEVGVWNVSDGGIVAQFTAGFSPKMIHRDRLKGYWPLDGRGAETDFASPFFGTPSGATIAAHPRVIR